MMPSEDVPSCGDSDKKRYFSRSPKNNRGTTLVVVDGEQWVVVVSRPLWLLL